MSTMSCGAAPPSPISASRTYDIGLRLSLDSGTERNRSRDVETLGELYDCHAAYAYRGALALLGDAALAEEAVEAAFLEVWWAGMPGPLPDAVFAAVYRACVARRRAPRHPAARLLEALPEEVRHAIALARFGGMTVAE